MMKAFVFLSVFAIIAGLACSSSLPVQKVKVPVKEVQSTECDICKIVAQVLEKIALENSTEAEVKQEIEQLCKSLPSSVSSTCSDLVDEYFDQIWDDIINDETPEDICSDLGLCTSKKFIKESPKVPVKEVQSIQCDICTTVVQVVEQFALENSTEAEVKQEIEQFCKSLPSAVSSTCSDLVDEYFDQIWTDIINDESPEDICSDIGLCTSKKFIKESPKVPIKEVQSIECDVCETVVKEVEKFALENSTEAEVKQAIEQFCKGLPSPISKPCSDLVDQYFNVIWADIIIDETPQHICSDIGLCTSKKFIKESPKVSVKKADASIECTICKLVAQVVEKYAKENSTEAEIKQELEQLCNDLPSSLSGTCSDLVNNYFDEIWNAIINNETPEDICSDLGLCTSAKAAPKVPVKEVQSTECDICKIVVQVLEKFALENSTEAEVKQEIEQFCESLPSAVSGPCSDLVNEYFDQIWNLIISDETPEDICKAIDLCTSKIAPEQTVCDYCKVIVSFLAVYIDENKTEEEILNDLKALCNLYPGSIATECNSFVQEYFPVIYELIKLEFDNDMICYQLPICSNTSQLMRAPKVTKPHDLQSNTSCQLCKAVANFLKPFVDSKSDEDDIKKALQEFCKFIPNTNNISAECMHLVNEYFDPLWTLVKAEVDSGEICELLGYCKNGTQTMRTIPIRVQNLRKPEKGVLCVICEYVMKEIESELPINATEADIIKVVTDICDALPTTIQKECTDFINEYGQEIINALINDVGPTAVCALLHLCSIENTAVMETPVGGSKCSWGPAYWCSTPEAAIECNAKDYCSGQKQL